MKNHFVVWVLSLGVGSFVSAAPANPVRLQDAYKAALEKTETLAMAESVLRESDARYREVRGAFLPSLAAAATYQQQNKEAEATGKKDNGGTRLTLSQSLFAGGRDKANLNAADANREAQKHNLLASKNGIYVSVAQAFYGLLAASRDVENIRKTIELTHKRTEELRKRRQIGKSRNIEVLAASAQEAVLDAQLLAALSAERIARDVFAQATGLDRETMLRDEPELPKDFGSLQKLVENLEERPDLKSLKATTKASESLASAARAEHLPSLDLFGNYYMSRMHEQEGPDWDAMVVLSVPLFEGGITQARVQAAQENKTQAELLLEKKKRDAEAEIRTTYNTLVSSIEQVKLLEKALSATEANYREQEKDYRFSLATNLDVLQALDAYQGTKRTLDRTRYQALSAYAELKAITNQVRM